MKTIRWDVDCGAHAPINIAMDGWSKPHVAMVWLFHPRDASKGETVHYTQVHSSDEIETCMAWIRLHLLAED